MWSIFIDSIVLFIFILVLMYLGYPEINNTNYLKQESIIFINIFWFYFIYQLLKKLKYNCSLIFNEFFMDCLQIAIYAIVGYSIYVDLIYSKTFSDFFKDAGDIKKKITIAFIISLFITIIRSVEYPFLKNKCAI